VVGPDGETQTHRIELAKRDYDVQRVDGVPDRTVNPHEQAMERIREEARRVAKARQKTSQREAFLEGLLFGRWKDGSPVSMGVSGSTTASPANPITVLISPLKRAAPWYHPRVAR